MPTTNEQAREARIRRRLRRHGYGLAKSRTRDPRAVDYGGYMIFNLDRNTVVAGCEIGRPCWSLDDVEQWIGEGT